MKELTDKQQKVLNFIEAFQMQHGKSPTIREIKEFLDVSSDNSVLKHLSALQKKGFLSKDDTPRGIALLESVKSKLQSSMVSIPLLGYIPAGGPVIAEEHIEDHIMVDSSDVSNKSQLFWLKVTGNSMIDAGIFQGDLVLCDMNKEPKVSDIVVALVDGENTLKRLLKLDGRYYLKAENQEYNDIYPLETLQTQGVVIKLLRNF